MNFSPLFPLGWWACLLSRLWSLPWVLKLYDLHPYAAIAAGLLRNRAAIALFSKLERFLYPQAIHIFLISESSRRNLLAKGLSSEKLSVIHVWADPDDLRLLPKENTFRNKYDLWQQFVLRYAENLGHISRLEDLLIASENLRNEQDICFVIVGAGVKKPALKEIAQNKRLENVLFLQYQPRELFPEMLATTDLSLVTLNNGSALTSFPGKVFNIMSSARPVLAVAPQESELVRLIKKSKCGFTVTPEHPELLAEKIMKVKQQDKRLSE